METNYEIAKLLIKDNTHQALLLKIFIMKLQEAYVKRVIEVFQLKPEDLDDTPEHFCEVFEFCEFLPSTTTTTTETTYTIPLAGEPLSSTISSTKPKASSVPETTAETNERTTPTTSVKTTSKIPADRIEVQPEVDHTEVESDLKELESKVEASEDKDAEAEAKALGTEVALEKIAGKVLFIFRCSKNWQKKSAGNHLLSK